MIWTISRAIFFGLPLIKTKSIISLFVLPFISATALISEAATSNLIFQSLSPRFDNLSFNSSKEGGKIRINFASGNNFFNGKAVMVHS